MYKKLTLLILLMAAPAYARFGEGFAIGSFAGLTGGLIVGSAMQRQPDVVVYEDPYYQEEAELAWHEEQRRRATIRRRRAIQRRQPIIIKEKVIETRSAPSFRERELLLKEKQIELELIRAKEALLKEENRKQELALRQAELKLK